MLVTALIWIHQIKPGVWINRHIDLKCDSNVKFAIKSNDVNGWLPNLNMSVLLMIVTIFVLSENSALTRRMCADKKRIISRIHNELKSKFILIVCNFFVFVQYKIPLLATMIKTISLPHVQFNFFQSPRLWCNYGNPIKWRPPLNDMPYMFFHIRTFVTHTHTLAYTRGHTYSSANKH